MARRLVLVHTNDVHGRVDALLRAATVIDRIRDENPDATVVYVDVGDVEETTSRLSNLTKGAAMHRLLDAAGCRAVAVGNGAVLRYGQQVLLELAAATSYPHLAANLHQDGEVAPGALATHVVSEDGLRLGLIGLTPTNWQDMYERDFGLTLPPAAPLVREHAQRLREDGADAVVLLSHLGIDADRVLAAEVAREIDLILGAHSHTLLPDGERVDGVVIAQAGAYAEHVGVVELRVGDRARVTSVRVVPVPEDAPSHAGLHGEKEAIERELDRSLAEVLGQIAEPLDLAADRECAAASFMADVIRERMGAEVGVVTSAVAFDSPLEPGPLTRRALYEACSTSAVAGVAELTGAQLLTLVATGLDPELAADAPQVHRWSPRGLLHLSGAEVRDGELLVAGTPIDDRRIYRVAGSDWELDRYAGYARPEWELEIAYDMPFILREVVEAHLRRHPIVRAPEPRIHGPLATGA
jgi:2',3'-cyclic-nucleotide 2'-phosphodiesterase (5'-nucleotidase family)